ncbi:MAG: hypothetical protein IIB40_08710 [Candidatus Marinimicrobia bacterium]|nr:hypothetical protein [Candidatus Neomarinimicrobiota bacterium]
MSLDFITEKQSYSAFLEESESTARLYKLMMKNFCEFIVNSRKLSERQVEIFLLRAKGFTFEEIGDMLGIRKQTVHESCMKTIQALKLPEDDGVDG